MLPGNDILEIRYRSDESVEVRSKGTTSPRTVRRPRTSDWLRETGGWHIQVRCRGWEKFGKMMGKWWGNGGHPKIIPDDKVFPYFPNLRTGFTIQLPHHGLFGIDLRWWFAYNVSNTKYSSNQPLLQCDSGKLELFDLLVSGIQLLSSTSCFDFLWPVSHCCLGNLILGFGAMFVTHCTSLHHLDAPEAPGPSKWLLWLCRLWPRLDQELCNRCLPSWSCEKMVCWQKDWWK